MTYLLASTALLTIALAIALAFLAKLILVLAPPPQALAVAGAPTALLTIALAIALAFLAEFILMLAPPPQALAVSPLCERRAAFNRHFAGCPACPDPAEAALNENKIIAAPKAAVALKFRIPAPLLA